MDIKILSNPEPVKNGMADPDVSGFAAIPDIPFSKYYGLA
jgi:hypothetical protein